MRRSASSPELAIASCMNWLTALTAYCLALVSDWRPTACASSHSEFRKHVVDVLTQAQVKSVPRKTKVLAKYSIHRLKDAITQGHLRTFVLVKKDGSALILIEKGRFQFVLLSLVLVRDRWDLLSQPWFANRSECYLSEWEHSAERDISNRRLVRAYRSTWKRLPVSQSWWGIAHLWDASERKEVGRRKKKVSA